MRASLIEKGIAHPVFPFAYFDQTESSKIPPPPPLPAVPVPPPLPPPRNITKESSTEDNLYHNGRTVTKDIKNVECQTSPSLNRANIKTLIQDQKQQQSTNVNKITSEVTTQQPVNLTEHKIRHQEVTVYYDQAPFFESFQIYQGYNPNDMKTYPVTFEPSVMCIHDNDSKTYESIQGSTTSTSSTEDLVNPDVTCSEIKHHFCYYIFCCGICCD